MNPQKKAKPTVTPVPDGPYLVRDLEHLANRKGPIEAKPSMALCRCGESANKPFCDGTHAKIGFSSAKLCELRSLVLEDNWHMENKRWDYSGISYNKARFPTSVRARRPSKSACSASKTIWPTPRSPCTNCFSGSRRNLAKILTATDP